MTIPTLNIPKQTILFPLRPKIKKQSKGEVADTESLPQNKDDQANQILAQDASKATFSGISSEAGEANAGIATGAGETSLRDPSKVIGMVVDMNTSTGSALATGSGIIALAILGGEKGSDPAPTGPINIQAPVITSAATASFAENGTNTAYTVTAIDADASAVLTYALGGTDAALFTIDPNTGVVTFIIPPDFEIPADAGADNVYDLTVIASDGINTSPPQAVAITVTNVGEFTPVITSDATASFAENSTGTAYTVTATDADEGSILTYALGGTDAAQFTIDPNTGVVTFLTSPDFETPADFGGNNVYDLTVTASHGIDTSPPQAVAITVTDVGNEFTPAITSGATASFAENSTGTAYTVTATDAGAVLTYALGGTDAALFTIDSNTGMVTFVAPPDFEIPTDFGSNNVYDLTVTANDGINTSTPQGVAITVTNVNEFTPVITSAVTANFAENGTSAAYTVIANDADAGAVLTYALGGADAARFDINRISGVITFVVPPNFETPADFDGNNVYDLTVTASDGINTSTPQGVAITVTNVNEFTPVITSAATASFAENGTGTAYAVTATDADAAGVVLTYALGGADATRFNINPNTGVITFATSPDFEAPTDVGSDNAYSITVTASDGIHSSISRAVTITVTATNDTYSYAGIVSGANIIEGINGGIDTIRTTATADLSTLTVNGVADLRGLGINQGIEQILVATDTTATLNSAQLSGHAIAMNESADGAASTHLVINIATGTTADFTSLTFVAFIGGNAWDNDADTITINGMGGAENITGTSFADIITGGSGADTLSGGLGNDTLNGDNADGAVDQFVFDTTLGLGNVDTIQNYAFNDSSPDIIVLDLSIFTELTTIAGNNLLAAEYAEGSLFTSGQDASDRIIFNTTTGALYYDADGNQAGAAIQFALISPSPGAGILSQTDFLVIA